MRLNLTKIGHDENILFEIQNKDTLLAQKFPEAHIEGDLPEIVQNPPPDWLPMSKKEPWWKVFRLLLV